MSLLTSRNGEGMARAELEASRARLVDAADEARRGLERDLHDGAQQRLVLALIWLQRAAAQTRGTAAAPLVDHALDLVQQGLAELRDLAHGLHPAMLDRRGLDAALAALAARAPLPVDLQVAPRRASRPVEAAFYFTIAEALTNVFKHAHATRARVRVAVDEGALIAEVVDDGVGGARVAAGSGLRGLTDRLDAIGGTLTVVSPRGGPTTIRACAPLRRLTTSDAWATPPSTPSPHRHDRRHQVRRVHNHLTSADDPEQSAETGQVRAPHRTRRCPDPTLVSHRPQEDAMRDKNGTSSAPSR